MKRYFVAIFYLLCAILGVFAQPKIVVAGSGNKRISVIDKATGKVEWYHQLEDGDECNTVSVTEKGEILYSYKRGAKLITADHRVVWDYKVRPSMELQSATLLKEGGFLLAACGNPAQLIILDKEGNEKSKIELELNIEKPHSQFRQVYQLENGNYLLSVMATKTLMEVSPDGKIVEVDELPARAFSAMERKDGTIVLSYGDEHCYGILDRKNKKEIQRVNQKDIEGVLLLFVAQIIELQNGNFLICNWHGHNKNQTIDEPQLIEVDRNGKLVWSINDKENTGKVSAAFYIDDLQILSP